MKAADCEYKEYNRRLTEKFIYSLDNEVIIEETIRELTASKETDEDTSEQILIWSSEWRFRGKEEVLDNIREAKEFDSVRWD